MTKIKLNFFITCEAAFIDKATSNLSIINIFENINTTIFPTSYPKFTAAVNFTVPEPQDLKCSIIIKNPDGLEVVKSNEFSVKTMADNQKVQFLNNFINTIFQKDGKYPVEFLINNEKLAEIFLDLKKSS